jgi:ATP-dependent helicase/nuclease subunit B
MSRRQLFTIAPHGDFLELLADRVLDGTLLGDWPRTGAFWLSDVTIILPTRRARLALADIFARRGGGATLLPDIRTFGGDSAEEEPFLPPHDLPPIPRAASALERRLTLSYMVRQFALTAHAFANPPNAAEVLWLADSLAGVIDDLTIEGISRTALEKLVPEELAANWQQSLAFLAIVLDAWPALLAERGAIDAAAARNERLRRQAAAAPLIFGERPVIAAGSTGSIPATAALLGAIARLPRGALVLPGLDTTLSPAQHQALLDGGNAEGHPKYGLAKLLRRLGAGIADVVELAGEAPRTSLIRTALAPPAETAFWPMARKNLDIEVALDGVSILAAPNADLEARAIALAARQALAESRTVGIVCRDQTLARRIGVELMRHDIHVDDPAGTPLHLSPAGRLVRQLVAVVSSGFAPVDTIALLRHRAVQLGFDRLEVGRLADRLDLKLRGARPLPGLAGLHALADSDELHELLDRLGLALAPLSGLLDLAETDAPAFAAALGATVDGLGKPDDLPGIDAFRLWVRELAGLELRGAAFPPADLEPVLEALMAGASVSTGERRRDDIHIWGELEARLQHPDLMILAGVNEDIWPAAADPGLWLSRGMRIGLGLEPPERQQGLAAHDFEMAVGNRQVLIAYAERVGTSPALPSRLVQRLDALVGREHAALLRARAAVWLGAARALDGVGATPNPAVRPAPKPPASLRPRRLSVTEIETLMRSPYDIYARHVLKLRRLDPLGQMPEAKERGTMIHEVFAQFVERHDVESADAPAQLMALAEESFAGLDAIAERRDIWLSRFARTAEQFLDYERERNRSVERRFAERKGEWILGEFTLSGRADRLDLLADGTLEILDFKTGAVPSTRAMKEFDAPQLLLEAAMAKAGAFPDVPARAAGALTYIKIGLGPEAFDVKNFVLAAETSLDEMVESAARRMRRHVEALLLKDDLPMAAAVRPDINRRYAGDYDHLARTDEWTLTAGAGE